MARPLKLTDKQTAEMQRRHIDGESLSQLAKRFKVGKATVSRLVSKQVIVQKNLANQLASVEVMIDKLPVLDQQNIRTLANQLKDISYNIARAAKNGSATAARISELAEKHSMMVEGDKERLNEGITGKATINEEALKTVMKLSQVADQAAKIPLNLLAANKERINTMNLDEHTEKTEMGSDPVEASKAYQDMVKG